MLNLKQNKGFLLISSYLIIIIILGLSAALFLRSVSENNLCQIDKRAINAKYNGYKGLEYAFIEIQTRSTINNPWVTHTVGDAYILQSQLESGQLDNPIPNTEIDAEGNYVYINPNTGEVEFKFKAYQDPQDTGEINIIVLSQGITGSSARLLVSKFSLSSLYEYFVFTPFEYTMGWRTWNAYGGKIHANGNIIFDDNATIIDVSELSTADYFRYYVESFIPPELVSDYPLLHYPWYNPNYPLGNPISETYDNNPYGLVAGNNNRLRMQNPTPPPWFTGWNGQNENDIIDFMDYDGSRLVYRNSNSEVELQFTQPNPDISFNIPNVLSQEYEWYKYYRPRQDGYDGYDEQIPAYFTNSFQQETAWQQQVRNELNNGLAGVTGYEDVLHDKNTGGEFISPMTVNEANFLQAARDGDSEGNMGIYIEIVGNQLRVRINGTDYYTTTGELTIDGPDPDGVARTISLGRTFKNTNSDRSNSAIELDIQNLTAEGFNPDNGIIYSKFPIILTNARQLPDGGLTTVSEENIYLKGNYNDQPILQQSQPSAAITPKYVYTLSNDFNYPGTTPETIHHLEYPYTEAPYPENSDFVSGVANWYAEHEEGNPQNNIPMPNKVAASSYTYVISLIGYYAYQPQTLERWIYYNDAGDIDTAPANEVTRQRRVIGAFIRLKQNDFIDPDVGEIIDCGWNDSGAQRLDCDNDRGRDNPGWPSDMTTRQPPSNKNIYMYDPRLANPNLPKPPGDFFGTTQNVLLEIDNTTDNFTHHYEPLY